MEILTEGRKEFIAWAGGPDDSSNNLLARFLEFRKKVSGNEANMDWWIKNKTPQELEDFMNNFKSKSSKKKEEMSGAKKIYDKDGWLCIHCLTYDAMKHYGKGTKWCIAGNYPGHEERGGYYFNNYLESQYSGYFVVINNNIKQNQSDQSIRSFVNNKWCVCPKQSGSGGSSGNGQADIWNAPDNTVSYIPDVPNIEGIPSVGLFKIVDNVIVASNSKSYENSEVNVSDGIVAIGKKAFMSGRLRKINLPDSVKEIGIGAFAETNLTQFYSNKVETIGHSCFLGCDDLEIVVLGEGIKSLPRRLFGYCDSLSSITIEGKIVEIDPGFLEGTSTKGLRINIMSEEGNDAIINFGKEHNITVVNGNTGEVLTDRR